MRKFNFLLRFLLIGFCFIFYNCEINEDLINEDNSSNTIVKRGKFNDFPKLKQLYSRVLPNLSEARITNLDSIYNFEIDSTRITEIHKDGNISYTIPIKREYESEEYFENLIHIKYGDSLEKAYISKYIPTEEVRQKMLQNIHTEFAGSVNLKALDFEQVTQDVCILYTFIACNYGGTEHPAGAACATTYEVSYLYCFPSSSDPVYIDIGPSTIGGPIIPDPSGGTGTGGQGTGTLPPDNEELITEPIMPDIGFEDDCNSSISCINNNKYRLFKADLLTTQSAILNNNSTLNIAFYNYLCENEFSPESIIFAVDLINFCISNSNLTEATQETINILDMSDGIINGEHIVVGPDSPINNMSNYLSCFSTTQGAIITVYADQPIAGSHSLIGQNRVGHAFIAIRQGTKVKSLGFYPVSSLGSLGGPTAGIFGNDENHSYDVSISVPVNATVLTNIINGFITSAQNPTYDLNFANCTDVAIIAGNTAGLNIPSCESPTIWHGQTPGTLGEIIRIMPLPTGCSRNTTGGTSPANNNN